MSTRLLVIYRLSGGDNGVSRPDWYSKTLCLKSFLNSLRTLNNLWKSGAVNPIFLLDNCKAISADLKQTVDFAKISEGFSSKVVNVRGNCSSYLEALDILISMAKAGDLILFAEDDYLWLPESLINLVWAFEQIPEADYLTPYDHPVRYDLNFSGGVDLSHWCNRIFCTSGRHFRSQESTCMTFMVRADVLQEDAWIHRQYSSVNWKCPNDRGLFRALQHLEKDGIKLGTKRLLLGPMPSLATHSHVDYLAPIIDWQNVSRLVVD